MSEIWCPIVGYDGKYWVSNLGKVRGLFRGKVKILKHNFVRGYDSALLTKDGIRKRFTVHRLLAMAFIPNPENKPQVNHKNCIKSDNRVDNLEWVTRVENAKHALENNRYNSAKGEDHYKSKYSNDEIMVMREALTIFRIFEVARYFRVTHGYMRKIKYNLLWKHIN